MKSWTSTGFQGFSSMATLKSGGQGEKEQVKPVTHDPHSDRKVLTEDPRPALWKPQVSLFISDNKLR